LTEINNAIAPAVGQLGGLDVLIVNAGTSHIPDFQETADEAYDALMGVNPKGECFSMFHVLPTLKECRRIVLVGSVAGRKGRILSMPRARDRFAANPCRSGLCCRRI
jgi:NADP-dependent 3-hydroxy acid dehydrogenase YdfG